MFKRCRAYYYWQIADYSYEREVLGTVGCNLAVLSGPNHAEEIGRDLPAASVLSTEDLDVATMLQKALCSQNFRIYANTDITGVELAGATKNIIAPRCWYCRRSKVRG